MPDIVLIKQRQSSREEKIEKPRFYVINLEPGNFSAQVNICPVCFIFTYRNNIKSNVVTMDAFECYDKLSKGEICTITKPLTKDMAETYLQPIQRALTRYQNKHNLDDSVTAINAIIRAV